MKERKIFKDILYGVAVGDAMGVPVEFKSRETIAANPVTDMRGYGTYNLPPGTWSDDSSLTFCLAESLASCHCLDLINLSQHFINWLKKSYWTPYGTVFDVGVATKQSIERLILGSSPEIAGGFEVTENGNGSLMRILPLLAYCKDNPIEERFQLTKLASSITHGHIRAIIACFYYLEFARKLLEGTDKFLIYRDLQTSVSDYLVSISVAPEERAVFDSLLKEDISRLTRDNISSSGYVIHTLEAAVWCLLTTNNYEDAVLKAVNLGRDTDTTGAVTGGLAGLLYGVDAIPNEWVRQLARLKDIEDLAQRSELAYTRYNKK